MDLRNFPFIVKVITLAFLRLFWNSRMTFYYTSLFQKKDFWRLRQEKSPAADITINLLVNFHLGVFPEKSWGIIYIFPGSSDTHLAFSTDLYLKVVWHRQHRAIFHICFFILFVPLYCNLEKFKILTLIILYGKVRIVIFRNLCGYWLMKEREKEKRIKERKRERGRDCVRARTRVCVSIL